VSADRTLQRVWYERSPLPLFLLLTPLSLLFAVLSAGRRIGYRRGWLRSIRVSRPVLIVGNISVGGTGKTPLVVWIAQFLLSRGMRVGIVTRGYGGAESRWPQDVTSNSLAHTVGDEAVLLATRTSSIVVAGPDRVAAAQRAIERGAQIVVSDDGLQHYRLSRDAEIAVIDAQRGVGNGWLLPAGPLRESIARLRTVDLVVKTQRVGMKSHSNAREVTANHELGDAINVKTGEVRSLATFAGRQVHAVAAIGNPDAFFSMLRQCGLTVDARPLGDHQQLTTADIVFAGDAPVLMTEKDAVKCRSIASERHWAVRLSIRFSDADERKLSQLLLDLIARTAISERAPG
jgi:tetraacyldisaccharide 4'-kinase